jgi:hypothetical protein
MTALEIAIGVTSVVVLGLGAHFIAYATPDDFRRHRMASLDFTIIAAFFGTVWFVARLWGLA